MRIFIITAAAILISPVSAATIRQAHPDWHITRRVDAFESHISASGSARSGMKRLVITCDDMSGLSLILYDPGMHAALAAPSVPLILKGGNAAPVILEAWPRHGVAFIDHAEIAARSIAENQVIGLRLKFPDGPDRDAWFRFSAMDTATRNVLLDICAPRRKRT